MEHWRRHCWYDTLQIEGGPHACIPLREAEVNAPILKRGTSRFVCGVLRQDYRRQPNSDKREVPDTRLWVFGVGCLWVTRYPVRSRLSPLGARRSGPEQDTEPPVAPHALHCSLISKDGSNAEKNCPTGINVNFFIFFLTGQLDDNPKCSEITFSVLLLGSDWLYTAHSNSTCDIPSDSMLMVNWSNTESLTQYDVVSFLKALSHLANINNHPT